MLRAAIVERWYSIMVKHLSSKAHSLGSNPGIFWLGSQHSKITSTLPKSTRTKVTADKERGARRALKPC